MVNISFGGIGVELIPGTPHIVLKQIKSIDIVKIGLFDISCRWKIGNHLGARFKNQSNSRMRVTAFLDALLPKPDPPPAE